jgi:hypothetical protein
MIVNLGDEVCVDKCMNDKVLPQTLQHRVCYETQDLVLKQASSTVLILASTTQSRITNFRV